MFSRASSIPILIAVIVLASIGLLVLQVRLLLNTAELKRAAFDQSVMTALGRAAAGLEELDVMDRIFVSADDLEWKQGGPGATRTRKAPGPEVARLRRPAATDSALHVSVMTTNSGTIRSWVRNGQLVTNADRPQRITVRLFDVSGRLDTTLLDRQPMAGEHTMSLPRSRATQGVYFVQLRTDEGVSTMRFDSVGRSGGFTFTAGDPARKEQVVRRVVESFDQPWVRPRVRSISSTILDSLLNVALEQQSIDLPYDGLLRTGDTSIVSRGSANWLSPGDEAYRLPVGLPGLFSAPETLAVRFPTRTTYVLSSMWPEISVTAALFVVIVGVFVASLRTIRRQREFAGRLSDFIGNMTHEFKTPLATISLASEALTRSDVKRSAKKIDTYNGVIRDENKRMGLQVERILQMTSLEEGELDLRRERLSIHELVLQATEKARMTVEHRGGRLNLELNAPADVVLGDRMHLENVLHNLLDNAIKYSPDRPQVAVTTVMADGRIRIGVRDRGIGIPQDMQERVFEKYFRVPTGNVHDVKGFGLGLSYVKLVVTSLGGTAHVTSKLGEGTEATISLPLVGRNVATKNTENT